VERGVAAAGSAAETVALAIAIQAASPAWGCMRKKLAETAPRGRRTIRLRSAQSLLNVRESVQE
jgi:hypothetical protein